MRMSGEPETLNKFPQIDERSRYQLRPSYNFIIYLSDFANTMPSDIPYSSLLLYITVAAAPAAARAITAIIGSMLLSSPVCVFSSV